MTIVACSVDRCSAKIHAKGMCQAHYRRMRKHGTANVSKPVLTKIQDGYSWCAACQTVKPLEDFPKASDRHRGVASYCRSCTSSLRSTRYRDTLNTQQRRWLDANPGKRTEYSRRYAQANPKKRKELRARLRANNPELYAAIAKTGENNRRARERNAPGSATTAQILARWEYYGGKCWICGAPAEHIDHVKPLAKGGSNWPANLRPACAPCNLSKRDTWPYTLEVSGSAGATPQRESETRAVQPLDVDRSLRRVSA
ncbi:HNH endonuclease [Glutamicibacter sp. MCAF14]|uniref:HNH endonuclease n=1 Tax=Glutamicibacter sp. MCAF14 TaxID=3233043 RepID=UPI003F9344D3